MPDKIVVLVVDDEPIVRMVLAKNLWDRGFVVYEAKNADDAIASLETLSDIGTIVTDFQMPGSMNGAKLAWVVRRRWPRIKVIVVSGGGLDADITLPPGIAYFSKPYKVDALVECITAD